MSLSREVADAYISVHGDLSKFRKDLERGRAVVKESGELYSDDFAESMKKHDVGNMKDRWQALTKALYSGEKVDWERALGKFDTTKALGQTRKDISAWMTDMQMAGYMTEEQLATADEAMRRAVKTLGKHRKAQEAMTREVADAKFQQDQYNKSLRGMTDAADIDAFEGRWKKLGQTLAGIDLKGTIGDVDWSKMQRGTTSLEDFDKTMQSTIARARLLGRVTDEESDKVLTAVGKYIDAEKRREAELRASTAWIGRMRTEADRAKIALTGMIESAKTKELERDFAKIATAMATTNWGPVAKDHKSMTEFRNRTMEVTTRMKELGRVSDDEMNRVRHALSAVTNNQKAFGVELDRTSRKFRPIKFAMDKMSKSWARMDSTVRLVLSLIAASAGSMATLGSGLAGSATALVSSLGSAAGSVVPLAAAMSAMGVAIGLAVSGMDDLKAKFPGVQVAADNIGKTWQAQAKSFAMEWGASLQSLLRSFNTQLAAYDFGAPLGKAMSGITGAFEGVVNGPGFAAFMSAMTTTLPAAFEGFGKGFAGVIDALLNLLAGAAPVAAQLGADFERWGTALGKAMEAARESGQLQATFEQMRESLLAVLDFAGSLGVALGTLFSLGASSGNSMLASLTALVDKFTAWMNTNEGRATMLQWFQNAQDIMASMAPVLVGIGQAMAILVTPETIAQFGALMASVGQLLPLLAEVLHVISQAGILNIFTAALVMIGQAIMPLMPMLGQLAATLGPLLQGAILALAPLFSALVAAIMPIVGAILQVVNVVAPVLIPAIQQIVAALTPVIAVIGQVVAVIVTVLAPILGALLVGVINNVVGVIQGFSNMFMGVFNIVSAIVQGFGAFFTKIFSGDVTGALQSLGEMFVTVWNGVLQFLGGAVQAIWNLVQLWLVGKLVSGVKALLKNIGDSFVSAWNSIISTVTGAVGRITSTVSSWGSSIASFFSSIWNGALNIVRSAWQNMVSAVSIGIGAVIGWVQGVPGRITGALGNLWNLLGGAGRAIMDGFLGGLKAAWGAVQNFVGGIANWIRNNKGPIAYDRKLLVPAGNAIMQGLGAGLEDKLGMLKQVLVAVTDTMTNAVEGTFDKSLMFIKGADAAAGLAQGLSSNKRKISSAMSGLDSAMSVSSGALGTMTPTFKTPTAGASNTGTSRSVVVESGAIQITTPAKNPETVAGIILDDLAGHTKLG